MDSSVSLTADESANTASTFKRKRSALAGNQHNTPHLNHPSPSLPVSPPSKRGSWRGRGPHDPVGSQARAGAPSGSRYGEVCAVANKAIQAMQFFLQAIQKFHR